MTCRAAIARPVAISARLLDVMRELEMLALVREALRAHPELAELEVERAGLVASIKDKLERLGGRRRDGG